MKNKNVSIGITYGIIIGLVYVILLLLRWKSAENIITFGLLALVSYLAVLAIMFYESYYRRKENGGYILLKDLFQTLFISVLIFEFLYAVFNFIYLKFIDPGVIDRMKASMETLLDKAGDQITEADKAKKLSQLDKINEATMPLKVIQSFLMWVAVSGVFALLISLIMKKKKKIEFEV